MARRNGRGHDSTSTGGMNMSNASLQGGMFDGPASAAGSTVSDTRSRQPSNPPTMRSGSQIGSQRGSVAGARRPLIEMPRNLDLGPDAFALNSGYDNPIGLPNRPAFAQAGRPSCIKLNSYQVISQPTKTVYQYDVLIGNGAEKRALIKAVWESRSAKQLLNPQGSQGLWIFDGNKIAWSMLPNCSVNATIDMDVEKGRESRGGSNSFRLQVRKVAQINLFALQAYLSGKAGYDSSVLQSINFIDQLLRVTPSKSLLAIQRSFFQQPLKDYRSLGNAVIAAKGVYQSLRIGQGAVDGKSVGAKLVINADVANTCFWTEMTMADAIMQLALPTNSAQILTAIQPRTTPQGQRVETSCYLQLKKLSKLRFRVNYNSASEAIRQKTFQVKRIAITCPKDTKFIMKDRKSGREFETNVAEYFKKQYNHGLRLPHLPCVETMKGAMYPAEVCEVVPAQRYPFKLSETQTAEMIKFAVTRPQERYGAIQKGLEALNWPSDPMLRAYGMRISTEQIKTNARLLPPPLVEFGQGKTENPRTDGRWRIDGKRFIQGNGQQLRKWVVIIFNDWGGREQVGPPQVKNFVNEFVRLYKTYGGDVGLTQPTLLSGNVNNIPESLNSAFQTILQTGNPKEHPQLIVCIVNAKVSQLYNRVKRNCDCRFGVVSQVMQAAHVKKCSPQYIGNVLMKVNAKLGGFSFRALPNGPKPGSSFTHFKRPTVVMGADVSHPGPGSLQASMAAISVSMDKFGGRYLAACQSNGHRVEMISSWNMDDMLKPIFREWMGRVAGGRIPQHLIYIRDGVSEGQYEHVLQQEVKDIRHVWEMLDESSGQQAAKDIQFTVIVASKRHHIRFFPAKGYGDQNGNPLPGTVVERDVTHPIQWDFYLCSHKAIQGTARPVHYHVLMDEAKMKPDSLIPMIYEQCYSYVRSSTPVSIHPAVYYAHLAAKRAVAHEKGTDPATGGQPHHSGEIEQAETLLRAREQAHQTGKVLSSDAKERLKKLTQAEYPPLVAMNNDHSIRSSMWFV